MHTSEMLSSTDFAYERADGSPATFDDFCPNYHPQDRIGVVCPMMDDGVIACGGALLACTTTFYDVLRGRGGEFFDYPQHFCILDSNETGVSTRLGRLKLDLETIGASWSTLDVWPGNKWHPTQDGVAGMLQKVNDLQIDRLFWPDDFAPPKPDDAPPLPAYVRRMLATHLKQVCFYNTPNPTIRIVMGPVAADLAHRSIGRLPGPLAIDADEARPRAESHRQAPITDFLHLVAGYFATE